MVNVNKFAQKRASEFLAKTIAEEYRVAQISSITLSRFVSPWSILINLHKFKHLAFSQKHAQTNIALRWKPRWNLRNRAWLCADVHRRLTQICQFIVNLNQFVQKIGSWNLCKSWRKRISFAQIFIIALRRFGNPWSILINLYKTRHLISPQKLLQTNLALRRKTWLDHYPPEAEHIVFTKQKTLGKYISKENFVSNITKLSRTLTYWFLSCEKTTVTSPKKAVVLTSPTPLGE